MMTLALAALLLQPDPGPEPVRLQPRSGPSIRASWWMPNLNGRFRADEGFLPPIDGSRVSFDDDLDIDDEDDLPVLEIGSGPVSGLARAESPVDRLSAFFWTHEWSGSTRLDETEIFNAFIFPAGTDVDSQVRIGCGGLDLFLVGAAAPGLEVDGGFTTGFRVVDLKLTMDGAAGDTSERTRLLYWGMGFKSEWHPHPYAFAGVSGGAYFSFGDIEDEILWDFETWSAVFFELNASAGFDSGAFRIEAGWRLAANAVEIERDNEDAVEENEFSFLLGGPSFSLALRF